MEKQVYTITEVQEMLQISRTAVYQFIGAVYQKQEPFIIFKIGKSYRISKKSFDQWVNGQAKQLQK
ncbi:MAG: helix-turn-helix domain-containing protein [Blautia sp.]|jgi:predicted DNA-binding transcriptional regulator AlpA